MSVDVAGVVHGFFQGKDTDEDILNYVVGCLEDDGFEYGKEGEEIFETVGMMLVSGGCCDTEDEARDICKQLATKLTVGGEVKEESFRTLEGGPVGLGDGADITDMVIKGSTAHMIQTRFDKTADMSVASDKDALKAQKRTMRDGLKAIANADAAARRVDTAMHGSHPVIKRNQGGGGAKDVHLEMINVSNGGKDLIEDGELMLAHGRRYGVIGRNGTGKTTLLRALVNYELKGLPKTCQVLHVEQEVVGDSTPVLEAVLQCDAERADLLQEEKDIQADLVDLNPASPEAEAMNARLQVVYKRLVEIDADGAPARAAMILAGLSFEEADQQRPTKSFSGGWRMRIALARALFVEPDLLLLDEPTNHLDLHAVLWLEDYLLKWPKTVLLVSHAREFLNAVCTDIIHLHTRTLTSYRGSYDQFVKTMTERMKNQVKQAEALSAKRAHVQAFVDKFRCNAKRATLVQSRIKALERMGHAQVFERDAEYVFNFPFPDANITQAVCSFNDVDFAYPGGKTLFKNVSFGLNMDTRAAIVGPNDRGGKTLFKNVSFGLNLDTIAAIVGPDGIGKTTLLNLIQGSLEATTGFIQRNTAVRMVTFNQHHVDGLELHLNPLQYFAKTFPNEKDEQLRSHLSNFGISGPLALQAMYTLSGGQKSRVAFAKITFMKPHMLLLDEPSNHLDMDAVDALIEGLTIYKGGVLMVSHDQWLIESTMDELWMCENGEIDVFHGSFTEYKQRLRAAAKGTPTP